MKNQDLYDQTYYESQGYCFAAGDRYDHKRILELIQCKKSDKVLEIGCGLGVLLEKIPCDYKIGLETNDYAIKICKGKRNIKVLKVDAEKSIPFKESTFDYIIMNEVIEHFKKPKLVLQNCYKILKKGGKIVISTPARNFFAHDLAESHFSEMTLEQLRNLVKECKLHTITQEVNGISFLYPLFENLCFKPFRLARYGLIKNTKKGKRPSLIVNMIDAIHKVADISILRPISTYRNFLINLGVQQLIYAEKK